MPETVADRELPAVVAELVLGRKCERRQRNDGMPEFRWWYPDRSGHCMPWYPEDKGTAWAIDFKPFERASDDYEVLKHVREHWDSRDVCKLRDEVKRCWEERASQYLDETGRADGVGVWGCTQYRPGDYSRAALAVVEARE